MKQYQTFLIVFSILLLASFFRFTGLDWDQGHHLHPDERFLTMVATGISWPKTFSSYLDASSSPLNPHNRGFPFFVYGTFPVFFTKWVAEFVQMGDYNSLTLVGRFLSGFFDVATVFFVFLIASDIRLLFSLRPLKHPGSSGRLPPLASSPPSVRFGLFAMFFYTVSVLPIQLSHFFAVDTYLVFFTTGSLFFCTRFIRLCFSDEVRKTRQKNHHVLFLVLAALFFGFSLASKVSGFLLLPVLVLSFVFSSFRWRGVSRPLSSPVFDRILRSIVVIGTLLFFSFLTFRIFQPYAFSSPFLLSPSLSSRFIDNMRSLKSMDSKDAYFPPAVQWLNTPPFLFPFRSIMLFGLGLPLGILCLVSLFSFLFSFFRAQFFSQIPLLFSPGPFALFLHALFLLTVFLYQGHLYTKNMRYFLMMYPSLCILAGFFVDWICHFRPIRSLSRGKTLALLSLFLSLLLFWPVSFLSIYQREHSRVLASRWIYQSIPRNATIGWEHWDDPLPLHLPSLTPDRYHFVEMPLYDPDVPEKWTKVIDNLRAADYLVLSSNRLWGSIPRVPFRYPIAGRYYAAIFSGDLGFDAVSRITSYPCFPSATLCILPIPDDAAEESFTVYDHPSVLIFKKRALNESLLSDWLVESSGNE